MAYAVLNHVRFLDRDRAVRPTAEAVARSDGP
jgi:hypothetical protein